MEVEGLGDERRAFGLSTVLRCGPHSADVEGYGCSIEASPGAPSAQPGGLNAALPLGPEARHQAQPQSPALSSRSPARACCLHPTEVLRTLRDPAAPGKSAAAFIPVRKWSAGPAAPVCPANRVRTFGLWTGRHLGSAVVWAKFNLSHAREHQLSLLYPAEGSRRLLIFT